VPVPVSVVIPCYRCAPTIGRALASVAAQTVAPLQVVVVDDASGDDTAEELRRLRALYGPDFVRIITLPENRGAGEARNAGWDAARGDYVAFLDADDTWHPRKLELQHRFMAEHPQFCLSGHRNFIALGARAPQHSFEPGHETLSAHGLLLHNPIVTPSAMIRRDVPLRFPEGKRYMEDHYLWTRIAFERRGVARMNAVLATTYKNTFGDAGLSSHLVPMELGELDNYRRLHREGWIGLALCAAMCALSAVRFVRRCVLTLWRKTWKQGR
jgi:glycosyltransferase involved in cell wall biosynthesis